MVRCHYLHLSNSLPQSFHWLLQVYIRIKLLREHCDEPFHELICVEEGKEDLFLRSGDLLIYTRRSSFSSLIVYWFLWTLLSPNLILKNLMVVRKPIVDPDLSPGDRSMLRRMEKLSFCQLATVRRELQYSWGWWDWGRSSEIWRLLRRKIWRCAEVCWVRVFSSCQFIN